MTNGNSDKKHNIIIATIGGGCTIIAAVLGNIIGNMNGIKTQNEYIQSQIVNVNGDENIVNVNNIDDLIKNYNELIIENEQYANENEELKKQIENLDEIPNIEFKNMGLCINGDDIDINKNKSCVVINGIDYFSKDFIDNLVDINSTITIKNNTLFLGRVIAEKTDLFSQVKISSLDGNSLDSAVDSYGNTHTDVLKIGNGSSIIYNLNKKYSLLKFKLAIDKSSDRGNKCTVVIIADDQNVEIIPELDKITTQELIFNDININNCTRLEIKCTGGNFIQPLIYDAEVYN